MMTVILPQPAHPPSRCGMATGGDAVALQIIMHARLRGEYEDAQRVSDRAQADHAAAYRSELYYDTLCGSTRTRLSALATQFIKEYTEDNGRAPADGALEADENWRARRDKMQALLNDYSARRDVAVTAKASAELAMRAAVAATETALLAVRAFETRATSASTASGGSSADP